MNVLFDLDGTLSDPRQGIEASMRHAISTLGLQAREGVSIASLIGSPIRRSFEALLPAPTGDLIEAAVAAYRERYAAIGLFENELYEGVPEALVSLRGQGARLFLATMKPVVFAERILAHFGLDEAIESVHGSRLDSVASDKTEIVEEALSANSLRAEETVMVGDRHYDMSAAVRNGVFPAGVLWGYGSREELLGAGARRLLASPRQLAELFGEEA